MTFGFMFFLIYFFLFIDSDRSPICFLDTINERDQGFWVHFIETPSHFR